MSEVFKLRMDCSENKSRNSWEWEWELPEGNGWEWDWDGSSNCSPLQHRSVAHQLLADLTVLA